MIRPWLAPIAAMLTLLGSTPVAAQFSIARPKPASIQQVSATTASLANERNALLPQIRLTIRYLLVDDATRSKLYDSLDRKAIVTATHLPPPPEIRRHAAETPKATPLALSPSMQADSSHTFHSPARVTTSVLSQSQSQQIIDLAAAGEDCEVSNAPAVILIDGKEAELNDVIQHPLVVDLHAQGDDLQPVVNVLDEGIRMRMLASLGQSPSPSHSFLLSCEVTTSEILEIKTHQLFGLQDEAVTVQVPIQQVAASSVSTQLAAGQTLLIDPHYGKTSQVNRKRGVPMLNKLPYVGRSFKNVSNETITRWMIVLLQPSLEPTDKVGP